MNHPALHRLSTGQPLFTSFPVLAEPIRVFGAENELGITSFSRNGSPSIGIELEKDTHGMPCWCQNGGRMYIDLGHPEICSPETTNPLDLTVWLHSMMELAHSELGFSSHLFANNVDWGNGENFRPQSFGSHESYLTSVPLRDWQYLAPYLVARTILSGAGYVRNDGYFEISQRASFIDCLSSGGTQIQDGRGIICTRNYPPEENSRPYRLHLIVAEANLNQVALFLKFGLVGLFLDLLEMGVLPRLEFDGRLLIGDLQTISMSSLDWIYHPIKKKEDRWVLRSLEHKQTALELLWSVTELAAKYLFGRDEVTDVLTLLLAETLEMLNDIEFNLPRLLRRSDAFAKLFLLREFVSDAGSAADPRTLASIDMQYHQLGPEGLQQCLHLQGSADRVFTDVMKITAMSNPPVATRASFRGWLVREFGSEEIPGKFFVERYRKVWDECALTNSDRHQHSFKMTDPLNPYHIHRKSVERWMRNRK